ncbi:hypothetical protein EDD17DRAFT_1531281 [Pisolithus thermaeus]|nr:hypothetical protein EDD17DRAFT_1531281 [Pisolithus thermaeus]
MLTRCKKTMDICTSRAFIRGPAESTLIGKLAATLGPQAWVDGDIQSITPLHGTVPPLLHANTSKRTRGSRSYKT